MTIVIPDDISQHVALRKPLCDGKVILLKVAPGSHFGKEWYCFVSGWWMLHLMTGLLRKLARSAGLLSGIGVHSI